jgi:methyl-accepting chemotaxis protein
MLHDKRKKRFVNTRTQLLMSLEIMLHALVFPAVIIIFLLMDPMGSLLAKEQAAGTLMPLLKELGKALLPRWPWVLISIVFVGLISIVFTHHISGPAFRFIKAFRAVREKDLTDRIKLRKFDYLQDVSSEFNISLDNLNADIKTIKEASGKIVQIAQKYSKADSAAQKEIDELLSCAKKIEDVAGGYRLS